jgi:hypothetical protein
MKLRFTPTLPIFMAFLLVAGCQTDARQQILAMDKSQVALRAIQSKSFDTDNTSLTLRTVIATLQDLGFTVDKVDQELGLVGATKVGNYVIKMTITVRPRGDHQVIVRASAQHNLKAISDALPYQRFFDSLAQALFLEAHDVN